MKNYFKDTIKCADLEEYKKLPIEARTTKKWWWFGPYYLLPMGLPCNIDDFTDEKFYSDWDRCYEFLREQYPIQVFMRHDWRDLNPVEWVRFKWRDFDNKVIYPVKCFFSPRNKEIAKQIPREWKAPSEIIKDVLVTIFLLEYKDGVDGWLEFDESTQEDIREYWRGKHAEYNKIASWIKVERPVLEKELEKAWKNVHHKRGLTYEECYGRVDELEKKIEDGDTEALTWIIKNRAGMD